MTFNAGDKVVLKDSINEAHIGIEGTVTRSNEGRTYIKITKMPPVDSMRMRNTHFEVGGALSSQTGRFRLASLVIDDLQIGDKIRVTRTGREGTEQVVTGTVAMLGKPGTFQSSVRSADRIALAFRSIEEGTSDLWASQVIELLDRPVPKFDAASCDTDTVVRISQLGTAIKVAENNWTIVIGKFENKHVTDEGLASHGPIGDFTVLS